MTQHYLFDALPDPAVTLAEIFRGAGYATDGFTGDGFVGENFGFAQGFDNFHTAKSTRMEEALDFALPWLHSVDGRPFFLFLHSYDTHRYNPPQNFDDLPDGGYGGPLRGALEEGQRRIEWLVNKQLYHDLTDADLDFIRHLYDTDIRVVDTQLQRLFDRLEQKNLLDRTVVVVTSDHGENFAEHGELGHARNMYEPVMRVPLLISVPAHRTGMSYDITAETIDIAPTLLELAGLPVHPDMAGESLVAAAALVLNGYKYLGYGSPVHNPLDRLFLSMLLTGLVAYYRESELLFDLTLDPDETHNLADVDPARTSRYRKLLSEHVRDMRTGEARPAARSDAAMSDETKQRLGSLGYIN